MANGFYGNAPVRGVGYNSPNIAYIPKENRTTNKNTNKKSVTGSDGHANRMKYLEKQAPKKNKATKGKQSN